MGHAKGDSIEDSVVGARPSQLGVSPFWPRQLVELSAAADQAAYRFLGSGKVVSYSIVGDPAGALPNEKQLCVRPLLVDGKVKEWTNGEAHAITDRTFVIRRALRLNDSLPGDKTEHWIWQRGPWIMIDRIKGSVTALHLPDYDPASRVLSGSAIMLLTAA